MVERLVLLWYESRLRVIPTVNRNDMNMYKKMAMLMTGRQGGMLNYDYHGEPTQR